MAYLLIQNFSNNCINSLISFFLSAGKFAILKVVAFQRLKAESVENETSGQAIVAEKSERESGNFIELQIELNVGKHERVTPGRPLQAKNLPERWLNWFLELVNGPYCHLIPGHQQILPAKELSSFE